jgi:hypothetical protein
MMRIPSSYQWNKKAALRARKNRRAPDHRTAPLEAVGILAVRKGFFEVKIGVLAVRGIFVDADAGV